MIKKLVMIMLGVLLLAGATGCKKANNQKVEEPNVETNPLMEAVDLGIENFIKNYAKDYIKKEEVLVLDYYVIPAIKTLENSGYNVKLTDYVSKSEVEVYYDGLNYNNISLTFKAILNSKAFGINNDKTTTALNNLTEVDVWNYTYGLIALNIANTNPNLKADLLSKINVIREEDYRDADYAGVALMATSQNDINKAPLHELINTALTKDGIMAWGAPSAGSTANVILGLIASGIDPTSEQYTTEGVNLIEALLAFENNGAFANLKDGEIDLMFATPQGFAALVAYKLFVKNNQSFNLFS